MTPSRWIAAVLALLGPSAAVAAPCPAALIDQLDGLYRWQLDRQDKPGPIVIASQRSRFTPGLYALLHQAYALTPEQGRFVDFDVFSGTQVGTFGAEVLGCKEGPAGTVVARVAVQTGLPGRNPVPPKQLRYLMEPSQEAGWRIADIVYPEEPTFRLSSYLRQLLSPSP